MKKIKSNIVRLELQEFKNRETGEVSEMTKIVYSFPIEKTENCVGSVVMESYKRGNYFRLLEKFVGKECLLEIDEQPYKANAIKYVIRSVDGQTF